MKKFLWALALLAILCFPDYSYSETDAKNKMYLWIEYRSELLHVDATVIEFDPTLKERFTCASSPENFYKLVLGIDREEKGDIFNVWFTSNLTYAQKVLVFSADLNLPFSKDIDTRARIKATHPLPQELYFLVTSNRAQIDYLADGVKDSPLKKTLFSCAPRN